MIPNRTHREPPVPKAAPPRSDLVFFNGLGGFDPSFREYVITSSKSQITPAPWINVLANPTSAPLFRKAACPTPGRTMPTNSGLHPGTTTRSATEAEEAFYIRDDERGHFWSPMPLPHRGLEPYTTRHGFGYSVFEHTERCIQSEVWIYTALDASVKFIVLKIKNLTERTRRISITGYIEWVLGGLREKNAMHIITEADHQSGAIFARNSYNMEFPNRICFFNSSASIRTITGNRMEFLGRNGTLADPAVMKRQYLSGKVGAGLDPCAAIQVPWRC
jgi:cellobiose phosphorylase